MDDQGFLFIFLYFFFPIPEGSKLRRLDSLDHEIKTRESVLITLKADIKSRQKLLEALQEIVNHFLNKYFITF